MYRKCYSYIALLHYTKLKIASCLVTQFIHVRDSGFGWLLYFVLNLLNVRRCLYRLGLLNRLGSNYIRRTPSKAKASLIKSLSDRWLNRCGRNEIRAWKEQASFTSIVMLPCVKPNNNNRFFILEQALSLCGYQPCRRIQVCSAWEYWTHTAEYCSPVRQGPHRHASINSRLFLHWCRLLRRPGSRRSPVGSESLLDSV